MKHYDMIVTGGGIGGCEAAKIARKHKKQVLVIEKEHIGGTCLNSGCIPSKFYLSAAKENELMNRDIRLGLFQGEIKPQFHNIMEKQQETVALLRNFMTQELIEQQVDVIYGEARLVLTGKEKQVQVGDEFFTADYIILANGSMNQIPSFEEIEETRSSGFVLTNEEIFKKDHLSGKIVIIGGGVSGIEMAYILNEFGCKVMVLEAADQILKSVDETFAKTLYRLFRKKGIDIQLNCKVTDIIDGCVVYEQDGNEEVYECDNVYISIGRTGNLNGIPEAVRRTENQRFIQVNSFYETNIPGIYAIGDLNGKSMLAHSASHQAGVAVKHIISGDAVQQMTESECVTAQIIYTHPEVAYAGLTEEQAKDAGIGYKAIELPMNYSGRYVVENRETDRNGILKLLISDEDIIIGGGFISNYASEEITALAALINMSMTCDEVLNFKFPHPTESEVIKNCMERYKKEEDTE